MKVVAAENPFLLGKAELLLEAGYVAGGADVVEGLLDLPVGVDDEGGADHPLDLLAVELLEPVRPVRPVDLQLRVREQREGQGVAFGELGRLGGLVLGDAQDDVRSEERRVGEEWRSRGPRDRILRSWI